MPVLYYFHDPMCSWCWGYRPTSQKLIASLPEGVTWVNVVGGLASDSDEPMPLAQREAIAGHWRRIETLLGTQFNFDFWTQCEPRRSTYPACRAVIAAARQGVEEEMIHAIQQAYYREARNPSDVNTLCQLARQLGLDGDRFTEEIRSAEVESALQKQIKFARAVGVSSFPSLVLEVDDRLVSIRVDYESHESTLAEISRTIS